MNSLRGRLLVLLVPLTAVTLGVTAVGIDHTVRGDLLAALDREALLLAQGVGAALDVESDGGVEFDLGDGDMPELEEAAESSFYAVADGRGEVLYSSGPPPPGLFPSAGGSPRFLEAPVGGEAFRVCLINIERAPRGDEEEKAPERARPADVASGTATRTFTVAAGLPMAGLGETLLLIRRRLAGGFALMLLLLVLLPLGATGVSLRPLRRLCLQADGVGPGTPGARLDESGIDREVLPLVRALNGALGRLGRAYELQKRFTADAAHELRTPLSAIRAQCEVSLRKDQGGEVLAGALQSIHRTTLRLGAVVESLLSLSRLERQEGLPESKPVNLAETAREVLRTVAPLALSRGTGLREDLPPAIVVEGDASLLAECLFNLVDNALRHTPPGSEVSVAGTGSPSPRIRVSDNGAGIPGEHLERIFERFHRVDESRSGEGGGCGLGLAIAREIANRHGAVVTVQSAPGAGSVFTLEFPPEGPGRPVATSPSG